ncbi:hypothetical protein [Portibacter marinus]|uniref:hypothetical protein n=1 Tax=Portibacter marinus TaxID=2898660 RepID=UPI001F30D831|nr:hypothetical protein [Portibacter marinus]
MNKTIICLILIILGISSLQSQKLVLETSVSKSFSGFGDMWGEVVDFSASYNLYKNFFIKSSIGGGGASQEFFSQKELQERPNLFVADEWTENFPGGYPDFLFDRGFAHKTPHLEFQKYRFISLTLVKKFNVYKGFSVSPEIGIARMNVKNSYVTATRPILEDLINEQRLVTILVPNIINFDTFMSVINLSLNYKIKDDFRIGLQGSIMNGDIILSTFGLNFAYYLL